MRRHAWLVLLGLLVAAPARAQEDPDARWKELLQRQSELEQKVKLLQAREDAASAPPAPVKPGTKLPDALAPLAGYSEKTFFLRDRDSWFVLFPRGRVQVDWYNFLSRPEHPPAGVVANSAADPRSSLRDTIFIKRGRLGFAGTIAKHVDFHIEAEFASLPTPGQYATLTDAMIVLNWTPLIQLQAGQFYTPFTLENNTSENYTDFMEKAAAVRFVVPLARDAGGALIGTLPRNSARYWLGVFNGDGQNFRNLDNKPALIGRAYVAPLVFLPKHPLWLEEIWVGGSFWWQQTTNLGGAAAAAISAASQADLFSATTQSGFALFNSSYGNGTDLMKNAIRTHLAPSGTTLKYAFEANVPLFKKYGLRAEFMHQSVDFREYNDVNPGNGNLTRTQGPTGNLSGYAAYVEAYAWIGGDVHADKPGLAACPHWRGYVAPEKPTWALLLALRYEKIDFDITGLPGVAGTGGTTTADPASGHYSLDVFEAGASLWFTRHVRLSANYVMNFIGNEDDRSAARLERNNLFFLSAEHELLFRLAVAL